MTTASPRHETAGDLPLDQVSATQLGRWAEGHGGLPEVSPVAFSSDPPLVRQVRRVVVGVGIPASVLALGVTSLAGVWAAIVRTAGDADGLTTEDAALVAVLAFATLTALTQARLLVRHLPWAGPRATIRLAIRKPHAVAAPAEAERLLLDAADADRLLSRAAAAITSVGGPADQLRSARRAADTVAWAVLGAAAIGLLALVTLRVGQSLAAGAGTGHFGLELVMRAVLFVMACLGVIVVARQVVIALLDRRRRRRRSATVRLVRQLSSSASGRGRSRARDTRTLGVLSGVAAATVFVASVGAWDAPPSQGDGFSRQPSVETGSAPPSIEGGLGSPIATESPEATRSAGPGVVETGAPSASLSQSTGPPTTPAPAPIATPAPSPTPAPTPSLTPVITPLPPPPADDDGDGVDTLVEMKYGSDPKDPASTPEDAFYDAAFFAFTCGDLKDNDLDALIDIKDPGCQTVP